MVVVSSCSSIHSEWLGCSMCSYCTPSREQLVRHVCQIHEHEPNFLVYCSHCSRSFFKVASFRRHTTCLSECCRQAVSDQALRPSILTPEYNAVEDPLEGSLELGADLAPAPRHPPIKWRAASSILSIKERHLLSQAAVDTMVPCPSCTVGRTTLPTCRKSRSLYGSSSSGNGQNCLTVKTQNSHVSHLIYFRDKTLK